MIPASNGLSQSGVRALGVFVGMIYGMCTIGYVAPALIAIFLIGVSGAYSSYTDAIIACWGNQIVTMTIGLFLFGGVMGYSGLAKGLAERIINAKFATGKPWMLTLVIMLAALIPSMLLHPLITVIIVLNICINIFDKLEIDKTSKWPAGVMLMVVIVSIFAQNILPFQMAVAMDYNILSMMSGGKWSLSMCLGAHMGAMAIYTILMCAFLFGFIRVICKKEDIEKVYNYKAPERSEPFDSNQKIGLVILIAFVVCLLLPIVLPDGSGIHHFFSNIGTTGFCFLFVGIAVALMRKDGKKIFSIKDIADSGFNWEVMVMLLAISGVCDSFTAESTGVTAWLTNILQPLVSNMSGYGIFAVLVLFALLITGFTDDIAIAFTMIPVVYTLTNNVGLSSLGVMLWVTRANNTAVWLPASCPHIAILYGKTDSGYITRKKILAYTPILILFTGIMILTFGWYTTANWFPV